MKRIACIALILLVLFQLVACELKSESESEGEIKLGKTEYTYESFVDDFIEYCCSGYYYNADYRIEKAIKGNKSIEKLIDETLVAEMREKNITGETIYQLFKLFPNLWKGNKTLVVNDNNKPLFAYELDESGKREDAIKAVKRGLRDPNSFYMDDKYVSLYVRYKEGEKLDRYEDGIYFYVSYHATNGYGGYEYSGVWMEYTSYGSFYKTNYTGDGGAERSSSFYRYNDLHYCGSMSL